MAENNNNSTTNSSTAQISASYGSPLIVGTQAPKGLVDHSCILHQSQLFIFGGFESSTKTQSKKLYTFDLENHEWNCTSQLEKPQSTTNSPTPQTEKSVETISPRIGHSCAVLGDKLYIFGGMNEAYLSDFWSYHTELQTWSRLNAKNSPPAMVGHTCITYNGKLYLYGGLVGASNTASSQLYCFDVDQNSWQVIQPQSTSQIPSRFDHTAVVYNSSMWIFGGCSGGQYHNDIYRYQFDTMQWTKVEVKGNSNEIPQPRSRHISVIFCDHMMIYGGSDRTTWFQDLWIFDFQLSKWNSMDLSQLESVKNLDIGVSRRDHTGVIYKDTLVVFGGKSRASYHDNRLISFDLTNLKQNFQSTVKFQNKIGTGNVYSMGFGKHGQLGIGGQGQEHLVPTLVPRLSGCLVTKIASGGAHTVAVTAKGELFQWGEEPGVGLAFTPHLVTQLRDDIILDASCGSLHTIAITKSDPANTTVVKKVQNDNIKREKDSKQVQESTKVFVWGDNVADVKSIPRLLMALENKAIFQIACTALSTVILTRDQFVYSWFIENEHQLTLVATSEQKICRIACGGNHVLLLTESGRVLSYGKNKYGQLGTGNTQDSTDPVLVEGVSNIAEIGCGPDHSLLVDSSGSVYTFGRNDTYQLGHGDTENQSRPRLVLALQGMRVISVAAGGGLGGSYSVCISDNGDCYTWGSNKFGQLGHNDKLDREIPTKIQNLPGRVLQAACGWMHTTLLIADSTEISSFSTQSTLGYFALLPRDIMRELLLFLDVPSLVKLSVLSSTIKSIAEDEFLWNTIFERDFRAKHDYHRQWGVSKSNVIKYFLQDNPKWRLQKFQGYSPTLSEKLKSAMSGIKVGKLFFGGFEARCLMVGLDAAGKTTILYMLKLGEVVTTIPTIGFNVETVPIKDVRFTFWDVGGPDKIRPLWRHYFQNTQMVISVIDSNDRDRLPEAAEELHKMMREDELRDAVLLVYANKQDLPSALPVNQIAEVLGLQSLKVPWFIQPCAAVTGEGLLEGLEWAIEILKKRI